MAVADRTRPEGGWRVLAAQTGLASSPTRIRDVIDPIEFDTRLPYRDLGSSLTPVAIGVDTHRNLPYFVSSNLVEPNIPTLRRMLEDLTFTVVFVNRNRHGVFTSIVMLESELDLHEVREVTFRNMTLEARWVSQIKPNVYQEEDDVWHQIR